METEIVQFSDIKNMLGDDPEYLKEFCQAAVISFTEFRNDYETSMRNHDMEKLKKTGHKIKPAAQMIGVHQVVDEYENAKRLLKDSAPDDEVNASIEKQQALCDKIIGDFKRQINQS